MSASALVPAETRCLRLRRRRRFCARRRRLAGGVAEELEEVGILAIGFGEQPVAFAVAIAAHLFGGRIGFGDDDGRFAIGVGPDLLRLLAALRAEFGGLALPLGLHALVDRLAVLLRQIGAPDPHIDHLDAVAAGFTIELVAD